MPVLVVDAAGFGGGEGVVGFGYLDEFFGGGFVASVTQITDQLFSTGKSWDVGRGLGVVVNRGV